MGAAIYVSTNPIKVAAVNYTGDNEDELHAFVFPTKFKIDHCTITSDVHSLNDMPINMLDYVVKSQDGSFRIMLRKQFFAMHNFIAP